MRLLRWTSRLWTGVLLGIVVFAGLLLVLRILSPLPFFSARPEIRSTTPLSGATNISPRSRVVLQFNTSMNPRAVERGLTIQPPIPHIFQWNDDYTTVTISPTISLQSSTVYTVTASSAIQNRLFRTLAEPVQVTFTTTPAPAVVSVFPQDNTREVALNTPIGITFSRPIVPTSTIALSTTLPELSFDPPVTGTVTWVSPFTVLFRPAEPLQPGTRYKAMLAPRLADLMGGQLSQTFSWNFSTPAPKIVSITPADKGQGVAPNAPLVLRLSQPLNVDSLQRNLTINPSVTVTSNTQLLPDATQVVTFTPTTNWQPNTKYTVELRAGAMPLIGNLPLAETTRWSFQTAPQPQVVGRFPGEGQTLPPGQDIRLIFNTPVDARALEAAINFTPSASQVHVTANENEARITADLQAATVYTMTLPPTLVDRNGTPTGQQYQFRILTAPAAPALQFPGTHGHIAQLIPGATEVAVRRTNLSALNMNLYNLDEATVVRTLSFGEADWSSFQPERYNQAMLRSWSVPVSDPLNTPIDNRLLIVDPNGQPLSPGAYYLRIRTPEGPQADLLLVISRTHLILQQSGTKILVWATDTTTGAPLPNLLLSLYDDGTLVQQATTDQQGLWQDGQVTVDLSHLPIVIARGEGLGIVNGTWSPDTQALSAHYRTFLTTDRTTYRPGDQVSVAGFVRAVAGQSNTLLTAATQATLSVRQTTAVTHIYDTVVPISTTGVISASFTLPSKIETGEYTLTFIIDNETFSTRFQVQSEASPPLIVKVETPAQSDTSVPTAQIIASTPEGVLLSNIGISWTLIPEREAFPVVDQYVIGDDESAAAPPPVRNGTGQTGADGMFTLVMTDTIRTDNVPQRYRLVVQASAPGGLIAYGTASFVTTPAQVYLGVRLPSRLFVVQNLQPVEFFSISPAGLPVPHATMLIEVYRRTTTIQRNDVTQRQALMQQIYANTVVTDDAGHTRIQLALPRGGEYRLRVSLAENARRGVATETSLWATGPNFTDWPDQSSNEVALIPDRLNYQPGDTARLLVTTPFDTASALVTIRHGDRLFGTVQTVRPGDFLTVVLDRNDSSSAQVAVVLIDRGTTTSPTAYRFGRAMLSVMAPDRALTVTLATNQTTYAPRATALITVTTTDQQGRGVPADVVLGIVGAYSAPQGDILATFQENVLPPIMTAQLLADGVLSTGLSLRPAQPPIPTDQGTKLLPVLTAYWNPRLRTDNNGVLTTTVQLSDSIDLRALVWVAGGPDRFGQGQSSLVVTNPLAVQLDVPTFLRVGDTVSVQARVQNTTAVSQEVGLRLDASGATVPPDLSPPRHFFIPPNTEVRALWQATAGVQSRARFSITVQPRNGASTTITVDRPILAMNGFTAIERGALVEGRFRQQIVLPQGSQSRLGSLSIEVAPSEQALAQRSVQMLAALSNPSIVDDASLLLITSTFSDTTNLAPAALERLIAAQNNDGGWGWQVASQSDPSVTAFVLEALAAARSVNLDIPAWVVTHGLDTLQQMVKPDAPSVMRAYTQYVLSRYNQGNQATIKALAADTQTLGVEGVAYLMLAQPSNEVRDQLLNALTTLVVRNGSLASWPASGRTFLSTETSSTALAITALQRERPTSDLLPAARRWLLMTRGVGGWPNSYTTARTLAALQATQPSPTTSGQYTLSLNGMPLFAKTTETNVLSATRQLTLTLDQLKPSNDLIVTGTLFLSYRLLIDTPPSITPDRGVYLLREYLDPQTGHALDPAALRVGQVVRVRLIVMTSDTYQFMMVNEPLPGGTALIASEKGPFVHIVQTDNQITFTGTALGPGIYEYSYLLRMMAAGRYSAPAPTVQLVNGGIVGASRMNTISITPTK